MGLNVTQKLIFAHLMSGEMIKGKEIGLKIDQTLTQDATGTMAYLQFEAMGVKRVKTEKSVAYIDHNTLQTGFKTPTIINIFSPAPKNTGCIFPVPETASVIRFTLNASEFPAKPL